jgi:uncharacterized RDD family membrane protein YckC
MQHAQTEVDNVEYIGFWKRLLASLIDTFWALPLSVLILLALGDGEFVQYLLAVVVTVVLWSYFAATPGKILLDINIVDVRTHQKSSTQNLIIRYIGYFVSTLPLFLGFFWIAWDKKKQGFHDKMANTIVISHPFESSLKKKAIVMMAVMVTLGAVAFYQVIQDSYVDTQAFYSEVQPLIDRCNGGDADTCIDVARRYSQLNDDTAAFEYINYVTKGCDMGAQATECEILGMIRK